MGSCKPECGMVWQLGRGGEWIGWSAIVEES